MITLVTKVTDYENHKLMKAKDHETLTDMELAALMKRGDVAAFKEIYERYWETLINHAYKRLDSAELAEDLVQDLFAYLFSKRQEINITTSVDAYLKTSLKRKVLNVYRSRQVYLRFAHHTISQPEEGPLSPQQELQIKDLAVKLEKITQNLPLKCRQVFELSRLEQLTNQQIAAELSISVSTVEKHISKALKIIRKELGEYNSYSG